MRVTFLVDSDGWGGAELWVGHHLRGAAAHGVVASLVATAPACGRLAAYADGADAVPLARHTRPGAAVGLAIESALRAQAPDVVVVNLVDPASNLTALEAAQRVAPTVGVLHLAGSPGADHDRLVAAYDGLALLVGTGRAAAEQAADLAPGLRAVVVTNGVEVPATPHGPASSRPPVVGVHARFTAQKGLDLLLAATRALVAEGVDLELVLGGGGRDEAALRAAAAGLPVRFHGWVDDHRAFLRGLDLFCLPSRHEALPLSMLEAMAEGVPCVVTDVGDVVERVGDVVALVPPDDVPALTAALRTLLASADRRAALGCAGRQRVVERLTAQRMVAATYGHLRAVSSSRTPSIGGAAPGRGRAGTPGRG